ncbi:MAG: DUF3048 domain-containing protein [Acidimicrobiaceae bacterium]|nr:DUF3048 domain-containing protein [Acidimicrobiaceae bacterium]MCY4279415.1 DUF3048 domain-containing protein [Acidimicrobiaceae bacterium]MCY4294109.1 DUF3048 domain-containing protein [Acidimicrobiaceae bacterium]
MTRRQFSHPLLRAPAVLLAAAALVAACSGAQSSQPAESTPTSGEASTVTELDDTAPSTVTGAGADPSEETASAAASTAARAGSAVSGSGAASGADADGTVVDPAAAVVDAAAAAAVSAPPAEGSDEWLAGIDRFVTGPYTPFTNLLTTDLSLGQRRPLAVKIGNSHTGDRPQTGLADADIVYEILVEGVTRFLAVFHSDVPEKIGPVRSARSSDFDLLKDLAVPYYVNSGANRGVTAETRAAAREGVLVNAGASWTAAPYVRDRSRRAPHNLYFYYDKLSESGVAVLPGEPLAKTPEPIFDYGAQNPPSESDSSGVTVQYQKFGVDASHIWDDTVGGWVRIQGGRLHTALTDSGLAEIAPANVVVLSTSYVRSSADRRSPQAVSYDSGDALVLTAGEVHEAFWERTADRVGFRFTDSSGRPLTLSAGSTWLLLVNRGRSWAEATTTLLTPSQGARMLAEARAAADPSLVANAAS